VEGAQLYAPRTKFLKHFHSCSFHQSYIAVMPCQDYSCDECVFLVVVKFNRPAVSDGGRVPTYHRLPAHVRLSGQSSCESFFMKWHCGHSHLRCLQSRLPTSHPPLDSHIVPIQTCLRLASLPAHTRTQRRKSRHTSSMPYLGPGG
jgi:hypothetical protein